MSGNLMRLDKAISNQGEYSRKDVKTVIFKGLVTVNGTVIKDCGYKIDGESDEIAVNGKPYLLKKNLYILMNKPLGVVSATEDKSQKTVIDLVPTELCRKGLFPAGRLDKDTTGMMIITDDGDFAHRILAPKSHIAKSYLATLDIPVTDEMKNGFDAGIELKGEKKCMPAKLEIIDRNIAKVTIQEGMYHQIKRMFGCYGAKVIALERISMGNLQMDKTLVPGQCRELTFDEILLLETSK